MKTGTLEARVGQLESRIQEVEARINTQSNPNPLPKRGWRAFVGVDANNPHFADAVKLGREWRSADSPHEDKDIG